MWPHLSTWKKVWQRVGIHCTAKYHVKDIMSQGRGHCQGDLRWQGQETHTPTPYLFLLLAVSATVSSFPPPPHIFITVAGLKSRGRTGDRETDGSWHQLKTLSLTLMGLKRERERTAPSGPDAAQQACGKMQILTQEKSQILLSEYLIGSEAE